MRAHWLLLVLVGCSSRAQQRTVTAARANDGASAVQYSEPYDDPNHLEPIARRIVQRVVGLSSQFPELAGAARPLRPIHSLDTSSIPWTPRFLARWDHEHGVSYEPDPTYEPYPHSARSPTRVVLDPNNGLQLTLWFYEGVWQQLVPVTPIEVGRLKVVWFLSMINAPRRAALDAALRAVVEEERRAVVP